MNIAITGTVGAGKSAVATLLGSFLNTEPVDADGICKTLLEPGGAACSEVQSRWGSGFIDETGGLNRVSFREAVFKTPSMREELEAILHPLVKDELLSMMDEARVKKRVLLAEIPLLYEVGWQDAFDKVVSVYVPERISKERTVQRDRVSREQVETILCLQKSGAEKADLADYVIDNSTTWTASFLQCAELTKELLLQKRTI